MRVRPLTRACISLTAPMPSSPTTIELKEILRDIPRPDFVELHHKVVFIIRFEELELIEVGIWLNAMWASTKPH